MLWKADVHDVRAVGTQKAECHCIQSKGIKGLDLELGPREDSGVP